MAPVVAQTKTTREFTAGAETAQINRIVSAAIVAAISQTIKHSVGCFLPKALQLRILCLPGLVCTNLQKL